MRNRASLALPLLLCMATMSVAGPAQARIARGDEAGVHGGSQTWTTPAHPHRRGGQPRTRRLDRRIVDHPDVPPHPYPVTASLETGGADWTRCSVGGDQVSSIQAPSASDDRVVLSFSGLVPGGLYRVQYHDMNVNEFNKSCVSSHYTLDWSRAPGSCSASAPTCTLDGWEFIAESDSLRVEIDFAIPLDSATAKITGVRILDGALSGCPASGRSSGPTGCGPFGVPAGTTGFIITDGNGQFGSNAIPIAVVVAPYAVQALPLAAVPLSGTGRGGLGMNHRLAG